MPPPVVGPSAASASASSKLWRAQENTPPPTSSSSQPKSLPGGDNWFLSSCQRDTQILTQALTRELSSSKDLASSSKSLAETLSSRLEGRAAWQSTNSKASCVVRILQQQQEKQAMSSGLLQQMTVDGFLQQRGFSQNESPLSSNSASSMSVSKEKPENPFNTSNLSANSTLYMPNTIATESFVNQQHQTHTNLSNSRLQDSQNGLFGNAISSHIASYKEEEAPNLASKPLVASKTASIALSSQASVGAGGAKVGKRRSRANKKAPIAVLSADASTFRAMVQQLTGIPTSPSIQHYGSNIWGSQGGAPLLKPHPTRAPYNATLNLPTLDTSACFLGPRPTSIKGPLQEFSFLQGSHQPSSGPSLGANFSAELGFSQGRGTNNNMLQGNLSHDFKSFLSHQANPINYNTSASLPSLWDPIDSGKLRGNYPTYKEDLKQACSQGMMREADQFTVRQAPTPLENFILGEDLHAKSSYGSVDSWFSFDGTLSSHSPKMEIARMA